MQILAKLALRNNKMVAARKRFGLSQLACAALVRVPSGFYCSLESLDYTLLGKSQYSQSYWQKVVAIAGALELSTADIVPKVLGGRKIESSIKRVVEVNDEKLLGSVCESSNRIGFEEVEEKDLQDVAKIKIEEALKTLDPRECEIIKFCYGLGVDTRTLEEVGHIFKVTRERIRQIEAKAVRKLQQPSRSAKLLDVAEGFGIIRERRKFL